MREGTEVEFYWNFWFTDKLLQIFLVQGRQEWKEMAVRKAAITEFSEQIYWVVLIAVTQEALQPFHPQAVGNLAGRSRSQALNSWNLCGWEREQDVEVQWQHGRKQYTAWETRRSQLPCAGDLELFACGCPIGSSHKVVDGDNAVNIFSALNFQNETARHLGLPLSPQNTRTYETALSHSGLSSF